MSPAARNRATVENIRRYLEERRQQRLAKRGKRKGAC